MFPQFSRPENPVPLADRNAFIAFLKQRNIQYEAWGEKTFNKRWDEIGNNDALYTTGDEYRNLGALPPELVVRHIRTVTARVTHEVHGVKRSEVLIEYGVEKDGTLKEREFSFSSLSEKMHWRKKWVTWLINLVLLLKLTVLLALFRMLRLDDEVPSKGLKRALREELNVRVGKDELSAERLFRAPPEAVYKPIAGKVRVLGDLDMRKVFAPLIKEHQQRGIELDVYWTDEGVLTLNQLVHYVWRMPERHVLPEGYTDPGTGHVHRWRSTQTSHILPD